MDEPATQIPWTAYLPRLLALAVVIAGSVWIVWTLNAPLGWLAKVLHILMAGFIVVVVAGAVGVEAINVFMTLAVLSLVTEGVILGAGLHGWLGAVGGVILGLVLSPIAAICATVLFVALASIGSSPGPASVHPSGEQLESSPGREPDQPDPKVGAPD